MKSDLPPRLVAVIGAGPIGLAATAHLVERGFAPVVFEASPSIAAHLECSTQFDQASSGCCTTGAAEPIVGSTCCGPKRAAVAEKA